jgi:hypothetical protein
MAFIKRKAMDGVKPSMARYLRFHTKHMCHHQAQFLFVGICFAVFIFISVCLFSIEYLNMSRKYFYGSSV